MFALLSKTPLPNEHNLFRSKVWLHILLLPVLIRLKNFGSTQETNLHTLIQTNNHSSYIYIYIYIYMQSMPRRKTHFVLFLLTPVVSQWPSFSQSLIKVMSTL